MHGRTLSWGLHWGQRVQTLLVERAYADVGEEYQDDQQNCGKISPGELRRSGTWNPIIMNISSTRHLGHRILVHGSGEDDLRKKLPLLLLGKTKTLSPIVGDISTMSVRKAKLVLLNPVTSDQEKYLSSTRGSAELVQDVTGGEGFSSFRVKVEAIFFANHLLHSREQVSCVPGDALKKYSL